jgi:UDP-glucose:(heptosyl)LPS alpha-1,3-glucosyltransferase
VAHSVDPAGGGIARCAAELVQRAADRVRFVVLAHTLAPELRSIVEWRRLRVPSRPPMARFAFLPFASVAIAAARADVVHTMRPLVPNRVDVLTVLWSLCEFLDASGTESVRVSVRLRAAGERWCMGRARVLVALAEPNRRALERLLPGVAVTVVPAGVDHDRFHPDAADRGAVRAAAGVADDEVVVLFVGMDWHVKGLELALRGFARARASAPALSRLWVVGAGDATRMEALATELGIAGRVEFLGVRGDVERLCRGADIFVLPSAYETFSLASFEAAATGLPVVAARTGGIEELVGADAGILVERDPDDIATAFVRLTRAPQLRKRMGEAARRHALGYTWERYADRMVGLYEQALARPI